MENNYLPDDEVINYEGNLYVNPEKSQSEMLTFIENLRNIQNQNTAEIATDTYNLGTSVPSNLGGLGGGGSYFEARYSTPQGVALANNLRATAQAQALNDILSNEQAMMKQRYTNAQRAARQRALARTTTPTNPESPITGDIGENPNDQDILTAQGIGGASRSNKQPAGSAWTTTVRDNYVYTQDQNGNIVNTDNPEYRKASNGYFYRVGQQNNVWYGDPKQRAENLSQLEKIRAAAAAQKASGAVRGVAGRR